MERASRLSRVSNVILGDRRYDQCPPLLYGISYFGYRISFVCLYSCFLSQLRVHNVVQRRYRQTHSTCSRKSDKAGMSETEAEQVSTPTTSTLTSVSGVGLARPGRVQLPSPNSEIRTIIRDVDIAMIKKWIREISDPMLTWSSWVTMFLGGAIGSLVSWILIPHHSRAAHDIAIIGAFCVVGAVLCGWASKNERSRRGNEQSRICGDIDEIVKHSPKVISVTETEHTVLSLSPTPNQESSEPAVADES